MSAWNFLKIFNHDLPVRLGRFLTIVISCVVLCTSCTRSDDASSEDKQVSNATEAIDKGDFDRAINDLTLLQARTTPVGLANASQHETSAPASGSTTRIAMVLASAHAAKAGVRVENFWGFVVGYAKLFRPKDVSDTGLTEVELRDLASKKSAPALQFLANLTLNLNQLTLILSRMREIPYLSFESRQELVKAIAALDSVSTEGAHLYRAILEIILLRSNLEDSGLVLNNWSSEHYQFCSGNFIELTGWLVDASDLISAVLTDLVYAFPSKKTELENYRTLFIGDPGLTSTLKKIDSARATNLCVKN